MAETATTTRRLKSLSIMKGSKKDDVKTEDLNTGSRFLQISPEVRMLIYKQAFTRTPIEQFRALHLGPQASSASALMLVCRQTRDEAKELYYQDAVTNLWPHVVKDGQPQEKFLASVPPIIASWRKSRHGKTTKHHPGHVSQLSLLLNLTRESKSVSSDYLDTEILKTPQLKITDLYLRVCICGSVMWLHDQPFDIMPFCIALETWAHHFPTLERIHILYCGATWPRWLEKSGDDIPFPDVVIARHTVRMYSGGNWGVRRAEKRTRTWGTTVSRDEGQVQPTPRKPSNYSGAEDEEEAGIEVEVSDNCKLRTIMSWNHSQAHPGDNAMQVPWKERDVEINYYDCRKVLNTQCVRDKPPKIERKEGTQLRVTRLTRERSKMYKGAKAVKNWVESWHLGPEHLTHHTKHGGPGEKGSHSRHMARQ